MAVGLLLCVPNVTVSAQEVQQPVVDATEEPGAIEEQAAIPEAVAPGVVSSSISSDLAQQVADELEPYDPGFAYSVFEDEAQGIHIKYPEGWNTWQSDTQQGGHIFITREPVTAMDDPYLAGIHLTQSSPETLENLSWIDFSNPKQAANQWLTALELASEGQLKLLSAKKVPVGERTGFFSAWLFSPIEGGYPVSTLRISVFGENYFSEILFECPAAEYEELVPIFVGIIEDPSFKFQ